MLHSLYYFFAQSKYNLKNAHALSGSFWVGVLSMILNNFTFFIIWFLFMQATGPINGWTSIDVFGMLGVSITAFGFTHAFFRGVVDLPELVTKGTFDGVLVSPVNTFLKIGGSSFSVTAYGDLLQGAVVAFLYGVFSRFDLYTWILYIVAIILGCIVFLCLRLLCSLVVFFVHDGEIISNQLFEIFIRPGLYPGAIFPNKMKIFFMTVVPALLTSATPIYIIKSHSIFLVLFGFSMTVVWVGITYLVYSLAVRRYESGNYLR
ncbi:MAG: ABC-2 family transporter protein [Patescibacteria group bacterium]